MKKYFFVLAAVIISNQLCAQDSTRVAIRRVEPLSEGETAATLDNIVVTANKYPKNQNETGKVMTIISRQEIERSTGKTLSELLNNYAGMNMTGSNNNLGNNITSSIRGSSAGNVLILVNGIPVNDPSVISNNFDLNFINLDQVARIEILKGGQSTLYGSDAVSGVINIITRVTVAKKLNLDGTITGGSYHTLRQSLGIDGTVKVVDYGVNYTHLNSEGFSAAYDKDKTGLFDKDGYNQHIVNARFGFKAGKRIHFGMQGSYSHYNTDLDASGFNDERDFTVKNTNKQAGGNITYKYRKLLIVGRYSYNKSERDYLDDSLHQPNPYAVFSKSNYTGRTHFTEVYSSFRINQWEFLVGGDYRAHNTDQSYYSTGAFGPYSSSLSGKMNQSSPYASIGYINKKGFSAELGGRLNIHSEYGNNFTFNLNPFYRMENDNKLFLNLYTSFKTPTLYQLFDDYAGNPDLKPETGVTGEAGIEIKSVPAMKTRLVLFYRDGKNSILYTSNPSTFESKYLNAAKQTNYGAELEFSYAKDKKEMSFNYTYTDGKTTAAFDGTGAPLGKDTTYFNLYRIPKHAVNVMLGYHACKNVFTSLLVHAVTKRDEFVYAGQPEILKGYATIDLHGEYRLGKLARVFLDLKNITNKQYFDFLGYNARRFNFTTGISFHL
ncbi:MAG: TonB-dependent receptor [Chitinophagaceae bacterium]